LQARGHDAGAVDLPAADKHAGLPEYTDIVPVSLLVLVNAMIPVPGETPGDWWGNTGWEPARVVAAQAGGYPAEVDLDTYFLHDVSADVVATGEGTTFPRPRSPSPSRAR